MPTDDAPDAPTVEIAADDLRWLLDAFDLTPLTPENAARYWRLHDLADAAIDSHLNAQPPTR